MSEPKIFTIDLLKGQGVPARSNPDKIALVAITITIPAIIAIGMFGYYYQNKVIISIDKQKITNYEKGTNNMSQSQALLSVVEKEKKYTDGCLTEVAKGAAGHYQWTPAIVEIVKMMPDSIVLKGIEIKQSSIKKTVPSKEGGSDVEITIPITKLRINVTEKSASGYVQTDGQSIRDFQSSLRSSRIIGSLLDNISISQGIDSYRGQDTVSYQIDCTFKSAI